MGQLNSYVVVIPYREPTYELRLGSPPKGPYSAHFTVRAASPEDAIAEAVEQFRQRARDSSVGWVREIDREGIRVEQATS